MKLSVIVTCYNVDKYLDECLKSILCQLTKDTQLIIVDDCSTDKTQEIIWNYAKDEYSGIVDVWINPENKGVSHSRNVGLTLAIGEYVTFIDGDDFVSKDYVKSILNNLVSNQDYYLMSWVSLGDVYAKYDSKKLPRWNYAVWCRVFKKSLIKKNFDENMSWAEDAKFLDENINKDMNCGYIKEYVYYYRYMRKGGITDVIRNGGKKK